MKKVIILMILPLMVLNLMIVSKSNAQDSKPATKTKKHIKIITIKDGVKEKIDTVIVGDDMKVFSTGNDKKFHWTSSGAETYLDSLSGNMEYKFGDGKGKKIIIMKHGHGQEPMIIHESEVEGDSGKTMTVHVEAMEPDDEDVLFFNNGRKGQRRIMTTRPAPGFQGLPATPALRHFQNRSNVIDLSDSGVISFKKKKMSGGREKITVIRNEVKESEEKTFDVYMDTKGEELKKMNEPRVVREFEIQKRDLGHPIDKKVEIKTTPEPEKK
jgi:hypothetical protein